MTQRATYLGFSVHWGLQEIQEDVGRTIVTRYLTGTGSVEKVSSELDALIECFFRPIEGAKTRTDGRFLDNRKLAPIVDHVTDLAQLFLHTTLSTGTDRIIYHGDDRVTPKLLTFERGQTLIGPKFEKLDQSILRQAREELSEMFPEVQKMLQDESIPTDDAIELNFLIFFFLDLLVSMKTDSRLLMFNPTPSLATGARYIGPSKWREITSFFDMFERFNGKIATPNGKYDLVGIEQSDFFGSKQFNDYCRAHDLLNYGQNDRRRIITALTTTVEELERSYQRFVDSSATYFLVAKTIERGLDHVTGGVSGIFKDLAEIVSRYCKDYNRKLVIYNGSNFKDFSQKVALASAFGSHER